MYLVTFVNLHYNEAAQQGEGLNFEARAVVIATGFGSRLVGGLGLGKVGDFVMGAQAEVETIGVDEVEVPCCSGLVYMARQAMQLSGKDIPFKEVTVSIKGDLVLSF